MKRWLLMLPLALFLVLAVLLYRGLFLDPQSLPSALVGKPFPVFTLPAVQGGTLLTRENFIGRPALVNVWGTWCVACRDEHPVLNALKEQGVVIYGVNYKDDNAAAQQWLAEFHDPYQLNVADTDGRLGVDLGVYGAPETFLIDAKGVIRFKHVGVIDQQVWREQLAGRYRQLLDEANP